MRLIQGVAAFAVLVAFGTRWAAGDNPKAAQMINAFSVAKEINNSYVNYDVRLTSDCRIDVDDPLELYWVTPDGKGGMRKDGLNFIEKFLYGVDVKKKDPQVLVGEVKALERHNISLPLRIEAYKKGDSCYVRTVLSGPKIPRELTVSTLYLKSYSGSTPKQIAVSGTDTETNQFRRYIVDLG